MNIKQEKKTIYLTVDTECHQIENLNRTIYGKTKNGVYGLEKILQIGKKLNIPVNVFLDIPECHRYGEQHTRDIIELVKKYNQPIFLHVHPDYIGDPDKKHLWEYTKDEQRNIMRTALDDYYKYCGEYNKLIFRAGAWGVNSETYEVLRELLPDPDFEILDLSYLYHSKWRCHLTYEEYGAANAARMYKGVELLPNTTYVGLDHFGKNYSFQLNVPNPNYSLFKTIINRNKLHNITFTMHSWDLIKRWFFLPKTIAGNRYIIKKLERCVKYAEKKGYVFGNLNDFQFIEEEDQCINVCEGFWGKITSLFYLYREFAHIGRSYKKYALLYFSPLIVMALILFGLIAWLI